MAKGAKTPSTGKRTNSSQAKTRGALKINVGEKPFKKSQILAYVSEATELTKQQHCRLCLFSANIIMNFLS